VLLVEDNPINQVVAETMLKQLGMQVDCAENGQEALWMIDKFAYDMVFMDLQMPVMSGLEALAVIRRKEQGTPHHLPVIALTANAMDSDREYCLEAGMDGYLSKPITLERLGREIRQVREKLA
jgi:CheY-like chemotaxis protein